MVVILVLRRKGLFKNPFLIKQRLMRFVVMVDWVGQGNFMCYGLTYWGH